MSTQLVIPRFLIFGEYHKIIGWNKFGKVRSFRLDFCCLSRKKIAIITLRNNNFQCSPLKITFLCQVFVKLISVWICIAERREWAGNFSEIFRNTEQLVTINRLNKVLNTTDLMWYVIFFSWFSQNIIVPIHGYLSCALSCHNIHVAFYNLVI